MHTGWLIDNNKPLFDQTYKLLNSQEYFLYDQPPYFVPLREFVSDA